MISIRQMLAGLVVTLLVSSCWAAAGSPVEGVPPEPFAVVDDIVIDVEQFERALAAAITQKFYHRRPPDDQLAALRSEVADRVVNSVLLLKEAKRRGIQPDEKKVAAELANYDRRNRNRPQWQESRAQVLPALTRALQENSLVEQLEAAVRAVSAPSEETLGAYYQANLQTFTEPEKLRLSMILMKVDPSDPPAAWEAARLRAQDLRQQITGGAAFSEQARLHSGDKSAGSGGDMGYWHRGTLPEGVEGEIAKLAVGAMSEPIRLLEGVAVLRLDERQPPRLRKLAEVRGSAAELWTRMQGEEQWRGLLTRLRADAVIRMGGSGVARPIVAVDGQTVR